MLTQLALRDDDESGSAAEAEYAASLTAALGALLPLISPPLLQYPKLCSSYFELLSTLLYSRPLAAIGMPSALYESVLASLGFGFAHHEIAICRSALETAYELARHAAANEAHAAPMASMLGALLSRVATDLLTSRLVPDVVEPAAGNALLALIVCQQSHWQALVASLLAAQPTADARERLAAAFGALLASNGVTVSLARPNRARFRANLDALLRAVGAGGFVLPA